MTHHVGSGGGVALDDVAKGTSDGVKGVWHDVKKHWIYYVAGAGVLIVGYLILSSGSSGGSAAGATTSSAGTAAPSTAATATADPNVLAAQVAENQSQLDYQSALATDQLQYAGQQLTAATSLQDQQVAASASATSAQISADSQDYIQTVQAGDQSAAVIGGLISNQNVGAFQALSTGFGAFMSGASSETSTAAGAISSGVSANDTASQGASKGLLGGVGSLLNGAAMLTQVGSLGGILPTSALSNIGLPSSLSSNGGLFVGGS
jgi:hypothetical protein